MERIKKYWLLSIVLAVGVLLRLINIDKPGGFWYDEMTAYTIASDFSSDWHGFWHFPLYYYIYHTWIAIFGNSDLVIRLMSVLFDAAGIVLAYLTGRQLGIILKSDGEKTGLFCMLLYAVNSSFIYYAQEAKFYSAVFCCVDLVLLFWLRFINISNLKNFVYWFISSLILILMHVSQGLLIFILYLMSFLTVCNKKYLLFYPAVFIPTVILCLTVPQFFSGNFEPVFYDNSFLLLVLQNFFSPPLAGLQNNIPSYYKVVLFNILSPTFWLFILFPVLYLLVAQITAARRYKIVRCLLLAGVLYISAHIILTIITPYNVLTRYVLPALPLLLLAAAIGMSEFSNKLFSFLIAVNLLWILSPLGVPHMQRPDGYGHLASVLIEAGINPASDFILPIRTDLLDKYYQITGKKFSFYTLMKIPTEQDGFISGKIPAQFENFVEENYITGNTLVVLKDTSICMFSDEQLQKIAQKGNSADYPLQFMQLSKLNNSLIAVLEDKMSLKAKLGFNNWEIFVFEPQTGRLIGLQNGQG